MARFRAGQAVVCIDDEPFRDRVFTIRRGALKRGARYTVRDYVAQGDWVKPLYCDEPCIRLHEIERRYDKLGFRESRFAPLEKNKKSQARKRRSSLKPMESA